MRNLSPILFTRVLLIVFLSAIFIIALPYSPLEAGPFLKIDNIDDSEFPKIKVFLTVKDLGKTIDPALDEENILLYEDGFLVNYVRIKKLSGTDNLLYLVFSIDSSKSISIELLKEIKKSANDFLSSSKSGDMIALYRFNDEVVLLNTFTNNRAELLKNINKIERHGSKTLLYNALYNSIDILNKTDFPRKAIIVFTDGKDEGSSIEINDVIEFAKDSNVPIYCITYNPQDRIKLLSRLTILTGGELFNSNKKDINKIYKNILSTIKNQYIAEYKSMLEPDGKTHNIEAKLKYGDIRDTEQKEITLKKSKSILKIAYNFESLLIGLITILIILLIIVFIFALQKINRTIKASSAQEGIPPCKPDYSEACVETRTETHDGTAKKEESKEKTDEIIDIKAWLVERDGINAGKKIPIQYEETTIGKDKDNRIIIDDKSVSGNHAKIKVIKNSFYLFDMASGKSTYLNENKLLRPKLLYDWDEIKIGKKIFIFRISNIA